MNRTIARSLIGAAVALAAALAPSQASAQTTFTACRVPDVGAIYMIGVAGAPTECLDASHVEFSWTEGGAAAVADGSITTEKLADGAVTSAKLSDGTITAADVLATSVQVRVSGSCAVGSYIRAIASNGTVTCEAGPSILGLEQVLQQWSVPASSSNNLLTADCPSGKTLLSGGVNYGSSLQIIDFHAEAGTGGTFEQPRQWRVRANNPTGGSILVNVHAICAFIS